MKFLPLLLLSIPVLAADPLEIKLWPEGPPGQMLPHSKATDDFIRTKSGKNTLTDIHDPTITVYRPEKPNGTSVIVAPGGGYVFLSAVHEGTQVCEWLNTLGITGILLKYRTPTRDEPAPHEKPVQDAAKAIALVRSHAKEWNLDPQRVGLLGFSAGGNLLAHIACDRAEKTERPDFGIMIYGGGWLDPKDPTKLKDGFTVPSDAPPMFIACAHDDGQNPIAATALYLEYKKQNLPAELHLFTKGGHGFGMRRAGNPINDWPRRTVEWIETMGSFMSAETLKNEIAKREKAMMHTQSLLESHLVCGNDVIDSLARLKEAKKKLDAAKAAGDKEAARRAEELINRENGLLDDMKKRTESINVDTVSQDILRLKKEKLELEFELDRLLQSQPQAKPKSP